MSGEQRTIELRASPDQLDRLGRIADRADNFSNASKLPIRAALHVEGLTGGMASIRDDLRALYIEISGENPW